MKHCSMKADSVERRLKQMEKNIERFSQLQEYERIYMVDYLQWLYHYKHITRKQFQDLRDRIYKKYEEGEIL